MKSPNSKEAALLDPGRRPALKTMAREKTKTSVIARKLKRTLTATRQKATALGVKLAGAQTRRKVLRK
jgi:hypothetical protein